MNKKTLLISASLLTGLIGTALLHRKNKSENTTIDFIGDWFYNRKNNEKVFVSVTPDFELYIQQKEQPVTITEQTPSRLAFLDSMGYQIIFEKKANNLFYFDETEDTSFILNKK